MKPKLARRSMSKDPYECQKPWPEDCFVQCGGNGIVFVTKAADKKVDTPVKRNYRAAFFEAFPKSPKCFIRGEGDFVEEAEAKAFEKFNKILVCTNHEWDRKGRPDGYCYCSKCPLSGMYLEPLTKCTICQTPTTGYTDKNKVHYCRDHYFLLSEDEVVEDKEWFGMTAEEQKQSYIEDQTFFQHLITLNPNLGKEEYEKMHDMFIHVQAELNAKHIPLFSPATKTKQELHEIIMQDLPALAQIIYNKIVGIKN